MFNIESRDLCEFFISINKIMLRRSFGFNSGFIQFTHFLRYLNTYFLTYFDDNDHPLRANTGHQRCIKANSQMVFTPTQTHIHTPHPHMQTTHTTSTLRVHHRRVCFVPPSTVLRLLVLCGACALPETH